MTTEPKEAVRLILHRSNDLSFSFPMMGEIWKIYPMHTCTFLPGIC